MLDNLLNTVKKGAEKVQRRGEEVAQIARLKMEIFQLGRELDGHYARLGRAYHDGKDVDILSGIREDIRHTEDEIKGRERLITELGDTPDPQPEGTSIERFGPQPGTGMSSSGTAYPATDPSTPQAGTAQTHSGQPTSGQPNPAPTGRVQPTTPPSNGNQPPFTNISTDSTDKGDLKL